MIWYLVPIFALLMITGSIALEFAMRNESRRPLSKDALNQRRWDDPNYKNRFDAAGSDCLLGHESFYPVTRDPTAQSKILAG